MAIICRFTEQLLQFCLGKHGIVWQPAPRTRQVDNADMVFNETIGNAVMDTAFVFQARVKVHSGDIWNRISRLTDPVAFHLLDYNIYEVSEEIYYSDDAIENTYIFLAVMVDVTMKCTTSGRHQLIQRFALTIPLILEVRLPNGFHSNFYNILRYALRNSGLLGN